MVARKVMDINKEAQEYLKQFSSPRNRRADHDDSVRESMFDTWTREKYRGKSSTKKGTGHLPKEWGKMSSAYSATNMVEDEMSMMDDLLNVDGLSTDQQDTYMNEEAFLEQLLQEDTKPHKNLQSKTTPIKGHAHSTKIATNGVHHSHKVTALVHSSSGSMDTSGLVQGHHSLNQSRRAVLRHVKPSDGHHSTLHESRQIQPQDYMRHVSPEHSLRKNSSSLKPSVHLMPVCQKCGWNLTPTQPDLPLLPVPGVRQDSPLAVDTMEQLYEEHGRLADSATATHVYSTLRHETVVNHVPQNGVPYSPRSVHHARMHSQSSTDSTQEQSAADYQLSPRQRTSLTTSKISHHKACQTDSALMGKDAHSSAGESGKQTASGVGGGTENTANKARTRAKPPSGRPPRADATVGSVDTGEVTPALEAAKAGNLETLKELLEADAEQAKMHDVQGNNLLHVACERGHMTCVQLIAELHPTLVDEENKAKFSPAALTIKSGHPDVLDWLIENTRAKDQMSSTANKKSLLHHAAKFGQDGCLRIVLEKLRALDRHNACCDSNGNSPAHVAAKHGHLLCLQTLLEYNMDVTKANRYGHSPCYYADFSNHRLCAGYLMVVETCLNLAKKLIRLERSMEQLSNSLAKYSDNNAGELAISVDYSADRSSATSSVEDDGTRDDAWILLCRKFEEASRRLVVFRTQNRAMRPLRPTKLALLALAQTKEEAQAALSMLHQTKKPSSTTKSLDGDDRGISEVKWDNGRSRSFPDLTSSVENEANAKKVELNFTTTTQNKDNTKEETYTQEGISQDKLAFNGQHFHTASSHGNTLQVAVDVHVTSDKSPSHIGGTSVTGSDHNIPPRKAHRRSSSVGDIIESERHVHEGDFPYHLKTRVMPPSPTLVDPVSNSPPPLPPRRKHPSQEDQWALPKTITAGVHIISSSSPGLSNLTEQNVKANERRLSSHHPHYWESEMHSRQRQQRKNLFHNKSMDMAVDNFESETDDNTRGAAAYHYDRNAPHRRLYNRSKRQPRGENRPLGENEQTSDFFEDSTGKHDSDGSELNPETFQKILDMQEEILRCHPNHLSDPPGTRIRTPVKLELTTEDFKETYARKEQESMEDEVSSPFRLRRAQLRLRHGDTMNKSGNNSYIDNNVVEDMVDTGQSHQETEELKRFSGSHFDDSKPWYEMTDDEDAQENTRKTDEYFTVL